eukprot:1361324-Amphidinium_carterae.1
MSPCLVPCGFACIAMRVVRKREAVEVEEEVVPSETRGLAATLQLCCLAIRIGIPSLNQLVEGVGTVMIWREMQLSEFMDAALPCSQNV